MQTNFCRYSNIDRWSDINNDHSQPGIKPYWLPRKKIMEKKPKIYEKIANLCYYWRTDLVGRMQKRVLSEARIEKSSRLGNRKI